MGAGNVKLVYAKWSDLPHLAFRVLTYMALVTKDSDAKPRYWAGRDSLLAAVVSPGDEASRRRGLRALDRAMAILTDSGALVVLRRPGPGHNAMYELRLSMERTPETGVRPGRQRTPKTGERSEGERTPVLGLNAPRFWDQRTPVLGPTHPEIWGPKEEKEEGGLNLKEEMADLRTAVTVGAHAHEDDHQIEAEPERTPTREGFGFCLPCHAAGKTTLAADPVAGSRCFTHLREAS